MAFKTITAANSIYMLAIDKVYPVYQQIQGFAADAAFTSEANQIGDTVMGVDAHLSVGYVPSAYVQTITLMPDSPSFEIFQNWASAERRIREVLIASATITLPSIGQKYALTKGVLSNYKPLPDVQRLLAETQFQIVWERVEASPF